MKMKRLPLVTAAVLALAATAYAQDPPPGPAGVQPGNPADPAVQPPAQQVIPSDEAATPPPSDPSGPAAAAAGESPAEPPQSTRLASALPDGMSAREACEGFRTSAECATTLHAAQNLRIPFADLKTKVAGGQKLAAAIHELKPAADAKSEVRRAEDQAHADLDTRTRPQG